ncbi:MAG: toll/interleukin-1 receptor domain-containing protein [Desulfobacterales bacterium]|nr:toll/interleukin-1 receptor domain-containing protein [Desulfobacterales bacterium]
MSDNPRVFCSHNSVDKPMVKRIAKKLADAGIEPWVDQWEISAGDDFAAKIGEGLRQCDVGLIFFSSKTMESKWVDAEVGALVYRMIEDGKQVIPVMIDADAPIPELLRPRARLGVEQIDQLIDAVYNRADKPAVRTARPRTPTTNFTIRLQPSEEKKVIVEAELDGEAVSDPLTCSPGADFTFSYRDFISTSLPGSRMAPADVAVEKKTGELKKLGRALGEMVFPGEVGQTLATAIDKARTSGRAVRLSFETDDSALLSLPFEAAELPHGVVPPCFPTYAWCACTREPASSRWNPWPAPSGSWRRWARRTRRLPAARCWITRPRCKPSWTPLPRPGCTAPPAPRYWRWAITRRSRKPWRPGVTTCSTYPAMAGPASSRWKMRTAGP